MENECLVNGCTEALPGASDSWVYLKLLGAMAPREGALCARHAYCFAALLNGEEALVAQEIPAGGATEGLRREGQRPKILVIDDDGAIRSSLCDLLEGEGYGVLCAGDGEEALAALKAEAAIAAIILDLTMPGMDGWSFRAAQNKDPQLAAIPVIVISAASSAVDHAATLQAAAVLRKPISVATLLNRLERLC